MDLSEILDAIPIGAFIVDSKLQVLSWNRTIQNWTGIGSGEIVGSAIGDRFPHLLKPLYRGRLTGVFEGGPPAVFSSQLHGHLIPARLPNGEMRVQQTVVSGIRDRNSGQYNALFSIQDVTELTQRTHNYRIARNEAVEEIKRRELAEQALSEKSRELEKAYRQARDLNSRLTEINAVMEQDINLAGEFQQSILPDIGNIKGFLIAQRYIPFETVSGDVYDISRNREGDINIFFGDATGHGVTAAFLTMMLHTGFRSMSGVANTRERMDTLNEMLLSIDMGGKFITGVFIRITQEGELTATHAGHHSLVIVPGDGRELISFSNGGFPLGLFPSAGAPFVEERYRMKVGDRVFIYTDGITERSNPRDEIFGVERVREVLRNTADADLESVLDAMLEAAAAFAAGIPANDDVTIMAIEYTGT